MWIKYNVLKWNCVHLIWWFIAKERWSYHDLFHLCLFEFFPKLASTQSYQICQIIVSFYCRCYAKEIVTKVSETRMHSGRMRTIRFGNNTFRQLCHRRQHRKYSVGSILDDRGLRQRPFRCPPTASIGCHPCLSYVVSGPFEIFFFSNFE